MIKNIIKLVVCLLMLTGCATSSKFSKVELNLQKTCSSDFDRSLYVEMDNTAINKKIPSSTFVFNTAPKDVAVTIACLSRAMFKAHTFEYEYVSFYFSDKSILITFAFSRKDNVLITNVFSPTAENQVTAHISTYMPILGTLDTMNGQKAFSFLIQEKQGKFTSIEYLNLVELITGEKLYNLQ